MTYEPTVKDQNGNPIQGVLVSVNNEMKKQQAERSTDGNGYANVGMEGWEPTDRVTIAFLDPKMRFQGDVMGDIETVAQANGKFDVVLDPFV
jgi:hypothetical protein